VLKGTCKMKPKNLPMAKPSFKPISEPLACRRNSLERRPENQGCLKKNHQHLADQTCQYKKKKIIKVNKSKYQRTEYQRLSDSFRFLNLDQLRLNSYTLYSFCIYI
jgi:hypothetical protein